MLKAKIGKFEFSSPLMNASGVHCETREELGELNGSRAGSFTTKTATLEMRPGNDKPRVYSFEGGSINSSGLPNQGLDYYLDILEDFEGENPGKAYILSVTELSDEGILEIMDRVKSSSFQGLVELNLSCPNLVGKPQLAYDFARVDHILKEVFAFFDKPLGVKLPPYFDLAHFDQVASILNKYPLTYVNSINSLGNGLVLEGERVAIKPKNGFGGIGGRIIKPTALANVHAFYTRLNPDIAIIGTGGVESGQDVFDHILCGASLVQVGSQLLVEGPGLFARLEEELLAIMEERGYASLDDFRGKLEYF